MTDRNAYKFEGTSLTTPAISAAAITPNDGADLADETRGIYTGAGGALTVDMVGVGTNITFSNVPAGAVLPFRVTKVYSTGTSGTGYMALY